MSKRSGTPETFAVHAIVPEANAESSLPDGAIVTERVSIISTYISFDVCRTPGRRHGIAGPKADVGLELGNCGLSGLSDAVLGEAALCEHSCQNEET